MFASKDLNICHKVNDVIRRSIGHRDCLSLASFKCLRVSLILTRLWNLLFQILSEHCKFKTSLR